MKFGANFNNQTNHIDFKLFSMNGTEAYLCLFNAPTGADAFCTIRMTKSGNAFEASFNPALYDESKDVLNGKPLYYGFRVFGPNYEYTENWVPGSESGFKAIIDNRNNRFNPNKLAYDPYTRELSHLHMDVDPKLENFRSGVNFFKDNQQIAPKSVFKILPEPKPVKTTVRALNEEIIGEVHIKSLTMLQNKEDKGTFKAAGEFASRLKSLGITMVEFLPVFEFDDKEGIGNYWGYMPLCYFALHKKYAFNTLDGEAILEFREMINALHKEDIKVCLDVVYNHTGEAKVYNGNKEDTNLFSYALIDNSTYYKVDGNGYYVANSGCHNDLNTAEEGFQNIIIDSLEYWINEGVDAFRFDLAVSLMDTDKGAGTKYDATNSIISRMKTELEARGIKVNNPNEAANGVSLIAEPWTCGGENCYQLGNFPEFFAEWNDISRNIIRANSVCPKDLSPLDLRHLIEGTPQRFENPSRSINYISCHDGFTLWDVNSYDKKSSTTCGGSDWELCKSCCGNSELRARSIRNQIALLTVCAGCFMIQAGDIVLHSKGGNNNSYNLDNEVNYINFDNLDEEKKELSNFIQALLKFRRSFKLLTTPEYAKEADFFNKDGKIIEKDDMSFWLNKDNKTFAFLSGSNDDYDGALIYFAINSSDTEAEFTLPDIDKKYYLVFDTMTSSVAENGILYKEGSYKLFPHTSILMLVK